MPQLVVAGIVSVRLACQVDGFPVAFSSGDSRRLSVQLGGTGWTAATTLRALGSDVAFATFVGADPLGLLTVEGLRTRGWLGEGTQVCDEQPRGLVVYDDAGTRRSITDMWSTRTVHYPTSVFDTLIRDDCDAVLLSSVGFNQALIEVAVGRGVPIATDMHLIRDLDHPGSQPWLRAATVLACSHEQLPCAPGAWVEAIWSRYPTPIVLVGCGSEGVVLGIHEDRAIWHVPAATPRGVRFTAGAGDTLLAAFVHHQRALGDSVAAVRYAVLAAGWKIGGTPNEEFGLTDAELAELAGQHGLPLARRVR